MISILLPAIPIPRIQNTHQWKVRYNINDLCLQERLDIGPAYLVSPAQRLASTATPIPTGVPPTRANTLPPGARIALRYTPVSL
jgi:hypothetical protein